MTSYSLDEITTSHTIAKETNQHTAQIPSINIESTCDELLRKNDTLDSNLLSPTSVLDRTSTETSFFGESKIDSSNKINKTSISTHPTDLNIPHIPLTGGE